MELDKTSSPLGLYYFNIFYPSDLQLEVESTFSFTLGERQFVVCNSRLVKCLSINDFSNEISESEVDGKICYGLKNCIDNISDKNMIMRFDNGSMYAIDNKEHYYRELFDLNFTEVYLSFEAYKDEKYNDIAKAALEYFIYSYRAVSNDILTLQLSKMPYVSNVSKGYFHEYTADELALSFGERVSIPRKVGLGISSLTVPYWHTHGRSFQTDRKKNTKNLTAFFSGKTTPHSIYDYVLKAREELSINRNYKYSFIESWTALETAIVSVLKEKKLQKGISNTKIKDYETEVGISYLINIELPLALDTVDEELKGLLTAIDGVRKQRNKVIHSNKEITIEEAKNALDITMRFLNLMNFKKY